MSNKIKKVYFVFLGCLFFLPVSSFAYDKTEMVYSYLNYDGSVKSTNVHSQLTKLSKGDIIDYTDLEEIKNLNGDEKFSRESDKIIWKSTGKDIFYQGKIKKELPIKITTKYYFNDREVRPNDIKGKSGTVKIVYQFKNNEYDYDSGMHTPFVISTISLLSSNNNSNISVSSGKVIDTGKNSVVVGIATPGLYNDLNIDELRDMDQVVVQYDTTKYKMNEVYFAATPKLLNDVDVSKLNKVDSINESMNTLQDGMNTLESGSYSLDSGINQLDNGISELNVGIEKALNGSMDLSNGLTLVDQNSSKLQSMSDLVGNLYRTYIDNKNLLDSISNGDVQRKYEEGIKNAYSQKSELETKLSGVNALITALEEIQKTQELSEEQSNQLTSLLENKAQLEGGISQVNAGISEAEANLTSLPLAASKLSGAVETLSNILVGILGVSSIDEVNESTISIFSNQIGSLVSGIHSLTEGSNTLSSGLRQLYDGSNKLKDGSSQLRDGSNQLKNGVVKINRDGIQKLSSYSSKLVQYSDKVKKLISLSKNYKGFSGKDTSNTIFIYKLSNEK